MTRINAGIPVENLSRQHLIAEHREIKRIPNVVYKLYDKGTLNRSLSSAPDKFVLGTGHVKFFYDKMAFIYKRYKQLYDECKSRGYNVTNYSDSFSNIPSRLWGDYEPTEECIQLITQRIKERT